MRIGVTPYTGENHFRRLFPKGELGIAKHSGRVTGKMQLGMRTRRCDTASESDPEKTFTRGYLRKKQNMPKVEPAKRVLSTNETEFNVGRNLRGGALMQTNKTGGPLWGNGDNTGKRKEG